MTTLMGSNGLNRLAQSPIKQDAVKKQAALPVFEGSVSALATKPSKPQAFLGKDLIASSVRFGQVDDVDKLDDEERFDLYGQFAAPIADALLQADNLAQEQGVPVNSAHIMSVLLKNAYDLYIDYNSPEGPSPSVSNEELNFYNAFTAVMRGATKGPIDLFEFQSNFYKEVGKFVVDLGDTHPSGLLPAMQSLVNEMPKEVYDEAPMKYAVNLMRVLDGTYYQYGWEGEPISNVRQPYSMFAYAGLEDVRDKLLSLGVSNVAVEGSLFEFKKEGNDVTLELKNVPNSSAEEDVEEEPPATGTGKVQGAKGAKKANPKTKPKANPGTDIVKAPKDPILTDLEEVDKQFKNLKEYGRNYMMAAYNNELPQVYLRESATQQVETILAADGQRSHALLLAKAGEGKTYTAYRLAQRILEGKVPEPLKDAVMFELDTNALVAGTTYRGDLEKRVQAVVKEITAFSKKNPERKVVVFIDEIHTIAASGNQNILELIKKPLLDNPDLNISMLGATTPEDWRKSSMRNDPAFQRRMKEVPLTGLNKDEMLTILGEEAMRLAKKYNVEFSPQTIEKVFKINQRENPDNMMSGSIDLIQLAASIAVGQPPELAGIADKKQQMNMRYHQLMSYYQRNPNATPDPASVRDLQGLPDHIDQVSQRETDLIAEFEARQDGAQTDVTDRHLRYAKAVLTGSPFNDLDENELDRIMRANDIVAEEIEGQSEALEVVREAMLSLAIRNELDMAGDRPVFSMLLPGPTGVGKTETAKVIAKEFFHGNLIPLDMTDFMEKHAVSKILGAPPGYVGFDSADALTEKVRKNPYSVVLFDEIEKAHPDVINVLLQILEEGRLIDNHGQPVDFSNCAVMMTSNLHQEALRDLLNSHKADSKGLDPEIASMQLDSNVRGLLSNVAADNGFKFRPEFVNRIDFIAPYRNLTRSDVDGILQTFVERYNNQDALKQRNLKIELTDDAKQRLIDLGVATVQLESKKQAIGFATAIKENDTTGSTASADDALPGGAREIRRVFQKTIENKVARLLLSSRDKTNAVLTMGYDAESGNWMPQWKSGPRVKKLNLSA